MRPPACWDAAEPALPLGRVNPTCLAWPPYSSDETTQQPSLSKGIDDSIRSMLQQHGPLHAKSLEQLLLKDCVSRQCLRVQVVKGRVYVVAPPSVRCSRQDYRLGGKCSSYVRQRTDGVAASGGGDVGKWDASYSPTTLRWHFAAGVNISDCRATIIAGDYNGVFTRLRLQTSLRLLEEAARAGVVTNTEFLMCLQETPINAGGWCLKGPQPIFSVTTNAEAALLAFPHWIPRLRDVEFTLWDDARRAERRRVGRMIKSGRGAHRSKKVVFRGGVYRLSVYSDRWRELGARKTIITRENWRHVGRTALLHALATANHPDAAVAEERHLHALIDAHVFVKPFAERLGINQSTLGSMASPPGMSLADQQARFRYVLNVEGHGGWADRLYKLLLSSLLVLNQDVAPRLWFEHALQGGATHLVVDSNLRNLSAVVRWAKRHDEKVLQMIRNAQEVMESLVSVRGIRSYVRELLAKYTSRALGYTPPAHPDARAIRFVCEERSDPGATCLEPSPAPGSPSRRSLPRVACHFRRGMTRFSTLHDAAKGLGGGGPQPPSDPIKKKSATGAEEVAMTTGVQQSGYVSTETLCSFVARVNARSPARRRWCFDFNSEEECHRHRVPAARDAGRSCPQRLCMWRPALYAMGLDEDRLDSTTCRLHSRGIDQAGSSGGGGGAGACVAMCPCPELCGSNVTGTTRPP